MTNSNAVYFQLNRIALYLDIYYSGLKYRWQIVVIHTGSFARMFSNTVIVTYKPLLWYFKGTEPKILESISDSVVSKPPDKSLYPWTQSPVEAEYMISKLTAPNDVVLD